MMMVSIFNTIFWAIMTIAFYKLYKKGNEFTKDFEKAIDIKGKRVSIRNENNGLVVNDARDTLKQVFDILHSIFKLSECLTIISFIRLFSRY